MIINFLYESIMKKITSILFVLLLMMASFTAGLEYPRGDVDQDGQVTVADVTCLIDYLLTGTWEEEPVTPPDTHEYVDLGLPSGTLWATCNVGATAPEEYGDYFAWGETEPKDVYDWTTYKWCNGSNNTMTKYCTSSRYGTVDNKKELDPEDDAAYVNWGSSWRMPSLEQQQELIDNCTWTWIIQNGVNGRLVTGSNGKSLFLPAAGTRCSSLLEGAGSWGDCWSRTLKSSSNAYYVYFESGKVYWIDNYRYIGNTVRAVRVPQN